MPLEEEEPYLKEMIATFDAALPARPKGWLGPGLSETFETPRILRDYGFTYLLDWCCDGQPLALAKYGLVSVPYSLEVNDISMWMKSLLTGRTSSGCSSINSRSFLRMRRRLAWSWRYRSTLLWLANPISLSTYAESSVRSVPIPTYGFVRVTILHLIISGFLEGRRRGRGWSVKNPSLGHTWQPTEPQLHEAAGAL